MLTTSPAFALAETLLYEWESRARHTPTTDYQTARARLLPQLAAFSALLLRPDDVNVGPADARAVLRHATAFRLGPATAAGPGRAGQLAHQLTTDLQLFPPGIAPTGRQPVAALLSLLSGPVEELEMDELTHILETVQHTILSADTELVFGHGQLPESEETGLRAWLLVGYAPGPA